MRQPVQLRMLLLVILLQHAAADGNMANPGHGDPSPMIQTDNLPDNVCPSWSGHFQVADMKDFNSYFVCCNGTAKVRKTCRCLKSSLPFPAPYDPITGRCLGKHVISSTGSFHHGQRHGKAQPAFLGHYAADEPQPGQPAPAKSVSAGASSALETDEAQQTCAAAAEAAAATTGSTPQVIAASSGYVVRARPDEEGRWSRITNSQGVSSTGVVGINAALLPESDQVLLWARLHMDKSLDYEPRVISEDGVPEASTVFDTTTGEYAVKRVRLTPFCTGNSHLPDGSVLAAGGHDYTNRKFAKGYVNGLRGLRVFGKAGQSPKLTWDQTEWINLTQIHQPRWYPTQVLLPDGDRTVIAGGIRSELLEVPVCSAEVFSQSHKGVVSISELKVLKRFNNHVLYPVAYVLPFQPAPGATALFFFSCNKGAVMQLDANNTWQELRDIPERHMWPSPGFCGALAMSGTATMLMLEPEQGYAAEVVMFGGRATGRSADGQCPCDRPATGHAHRIKLDKGKIYQGPLQWEKEAMPYNRTLNDAVLLPNGQVVVLNGAQRGLIDNARDSARDAWLYDPKAAADKRFKTLAATNIHRFYHSTALLLPDASIFVAGSEYGACTKQCAAKTRYLFQHQAERFMPPYLFTGDRPSITWISTKKAKYGSAVTVRYEGIVTSATLMSPAAVTHQVNMNQRAVKLVVSQNDIDAGQLILAMPPNSYIIAPGWHMLFLMNDDTPCKKASWLQLIL